MGEKSKNLIAWVAAAMVALSVLASASIVTYGLIKTRFQPNTITVTGSAKKQIKSDYVTWTASFSRQSAVISDAYGMLQGDLGKVKKYLSDNGLTNKDYTVSAVNTMVIYTITSNGMISNNVEGYRLTQQVEIDSNDVDKITAISRESTRLIQDGVQLQSMPPNYYYTKIADLKIDMLALATKDAKTRAQKIAENSGAVLGSLRSAKMGVFQITPINSNDISDYGANDTTSIQKEIMSVMNCVFATK